MQRELNRILAEADGDVKLSHDSEDSSPSASSSSSISSASSEDDDDYEHPRRLFLEEIAEENEDEEEEEQEDNESDEEEEENVDEDNENLVINFKEKPLTVDDDKGELDEPCSDIASDSDATITNEHCTVEEIETDYGESKTKIVRRSSSHVVEIEAQMLNKEHKDRISEECSSKKQVEIVLHKAEDDDSKSAVENEWGNEQIDGTPKETSAEHARGETGISTETDYQEPVESEQQHQYQQQLHSFNQEKYSDEALQYDEHSGSEPKSNYELYNGCAAADVYKESVSVSQQPLKFLHQQQQQKKKQHEHPKEPSDQPVLKENTNRVGTVSYSGACNAAAEKVDEEENEEVDNNDDDDDDDGESSCTGSTTSGTGSSGSSIETLEELEEQAQKQHGHVEIRLFHDVGSNSGSCTNTGERTTKYISREWGSRESKCRAVLVDLQTSTSSEVHDLVPESSGESGTGSSSPISSSPLPPTSPSFPLKSSFLSSTPINSSYLLAGKKARGEDVSVCDSCTKNTSTRPTIIKNNKISNNTSAAVAATAKISYSSTTSYPHSTPQISTASSKSPSILITSPKPSPTTEVERVLTSSLSSALTTVAANPPKLKKVSFQNHIESKTYNTSDEPSSVSLSASNFNKDEKEYSDDDEENSEALTNSQDNSAGLTREQKRQELKSSYSAASSYSSDSSNFYNNSQFSTADFWASRNGGVDINEHQQRQQYLQSLYYSESENSASSTSTSTEEAYSHNQQSSSSSNNHRYYYPSEYFNGSLREPTAQNNSSEDSETSTSSVSANSNSIWKEIKYFPERAKEQQAGDNIYSTRTTTTSSSVPPTSLQTSPTRPTSVLDNNRNAGKPALNRHFSVAH